MGIESLLYENEKSRMDGYKRRIDSILSAEERLIEGIASGEVTSEGLSLSLVGIRQQKRECELLIKRIREDMAYLSGEYLSATGVYEATAEGMLFRLSRMESAIDEALSNQDMAESAGSAATLSQTLRSFAEVVSGEK